MNTTTSNIVHSSIGAMLKLIGATTIIVGIAASLLLFIFDNTVSITISIICFFSSLTSGCLFLGFAQVIFLLEKLVYVNENATNGNILSSESTQPDERTFTQNTQKTSPDIKTEATSVKNEVISALHSCDSYYALKFTWAKFKLDKNISFQKYTSDIFNKAKDEEAFGAEKLQVRMDYIAKLIESLEKEPNEAWINKY